jgi:hypothetical protein
MRETKRGSHPSALKAVASVFGVGCGLGGIHHGIGEIVQGNVAPEGVVFFSWTQGPIATNMGGEPAMTLIPNLLATGIVCILVSLMLIGWSAGLAGRRRGGLILLLLSVLLLLSGGGFAPPVMGILAGVAGVGIRSRHRWWRSRLSSKALRLLAGSWPWVFVLSVANSVLLVVGSIVLVLLFGLNMPDLFVYSFFAAVVLILLDILTGTARDIWISE